MSLGGDRPVPGARSFLASCYFVVEVVFEIVEIVEESCYLRAEGLSLRRLPVATHFGQAASLERSRRRRLPRSRDKKDLLSPCRGPMPAPYNILFLSSVPFFNFSYTPKTLKQA